MVSAISFGWFADFGKTLTIFNSHPNWFFLTNGKHPTTFQLCGMFLEFDWLTKRVTARVTPIQPLPARKPGQIVSVICR